MLASIQIAYLKSARSIAQHLILVPNTTVRARLVDAFDPKRPEYVFRVFPFFCGTHADDGERLSLHVMEPGKSAAGIRSANIVLGNVHQIYEGKDNWRVIYENCARLAIFNDEAHNTKAEQYNDLINKLKPKRVIRIDTTATPDRLDGLHPDSEMIYVYGIREAMRDKIVKRVVVFKPDVEKVRFTYFDLETKKEITAEEMPWEDIERKKIPAVRYVTNPKPMAQQLGIALECLKYQRRTVPPGPDGRPSYKPLLFVVALSIKDAENIKATLESMEIGGEPLKALLIHNESEEELRDEAMAINRDIRNCKYDAIVSVMMLREGWDVKNISVILLFRRFSYTVIGDQIYSVYGPQIIGRGLRRIHPTSEDWEQCHVVDHPILKHDWLWKMIEAYQYSEALNPGDIIDEQKIPEPRPEETVEDATKERMEEPIFDPSDLPEVPEPPEEIQAITDWQKYLDEAQYELRGMDIQQTIRQIQSKNLDSGFDSLEKKDLPHIDVKDVNSTAESSVDQLRYLLAAQARRLAHDALMEYDRNPDARQEILLQVINDHLRKRFLLGHGVHECSDQRLLEMVWALFDQIRANFLNPALITSILSQPPRAEAYAESAGKAF
jgi:type III restriction enzyme